MTSETPPTEPISGEKIAKIRSDLDIVRNNMTVFSEMLTELNPNPSGGGNPADLELLQELHKTCREMQSRVGQLLCTPTTDELTVDMLQINDDMNDLFDRYDRKTAAYNLKASSGDAPLIDFGGGGEEGATTNLAQNLGAMNLQKGDADFDQFVSSRSAKGGGGGAKDKEKKEGTVAAGWTEEDIISGHRESDFEEMEAWLRANPGAETSLTSMSAPIDAYLAQGGSQQKPGQDNSSTAAK